MGRLIAPIDHFETARINNTLHGRSIHHYGNREGHNVFKGWTTWLNNGHVGVGDALDVAGQGWRTPVVAVCDGVQSVFRNDMTKLEVIYLEGDGVVAVYAHINARFEGEGKRWERGDTIGVVRGDLTAPHVHFELWLDGRAVTAPTPEELRAEMLSLFAGDDTTPVKLVTWGTEDVIATVSMVPGGDHIADQGKLYVTDTEV